jgi:hypothetical protein
MCKIGRQRIQVTGTVELDKVRKKLELSGARDIKIKTRKPTQRQRRSKFQLPTKYWISYTPAVTSVSSKPAGRKAGPWLKPTTFYATSRNFRASGVRV